MLADCSPAISRRPNARTCADSRREIVPCCSSHASSAFLSVAAGHLRHLLATVCEAHHPRHGADVRQDFNWNRKAVGGMGYRYRRSILNLMTMKASKHPVLAVPEVFTADLAVAFLPTQLVLRSALGTRLDCLLLFWS